MKKNDCFVCFSSGSKAHVGKAALIAEDTNFWAGGFMGILRLRDDAKLQPKYLHILLNSEAMRAVFRASSTGSNINNLSNFIGEIKIPIPLKHDQDVLITQCGKIEQKMRNARSKQVMESLRAEKSKVVESFLK